jgi:hypothetical protein
VAHVATNPLFANPQQVLPLAKVALESHALGNLKRRDDAALDLLSGLSGAFASQSVLPARTVQVSRKLVVLTVL